MEETKLSGETTNPTPPVEEPTPHRAHWEWRERIRNDARMSFPEHYIFEEFDDDCNCYNFYWYDMDGETEGITLKEKDIKRMWLFYLKSKSEEKYRRHIMDN